MYSLFSSGAVPRRSFSLNQYTLIFVAGQLFFHEIFVDTHKTILFQMKIEGVVQPLHSQLHPVGAVGAGSIDLGGRDAGAVDALFK